MSGSKPSRWAIQIAGEGLDIADALHFFGEPSDPTIRSETDGAGAPITVLTSSHLDVFNSAQEADAAGARLLGLVNGALFAIEAGRRPLRACGIRERRSDGLWGGRVVAVAGRISARSRVRAVGQAIVNGVPSRSHVIQPPFSRWVTEANRDARAGDVLIFLSGEPDWFNFYKAFELMRDDINERLGQHRHQQMGWPPKKALDHFQLSAQVYRHAPPWATGYGPSTAMPLGDATRFIHRLAATWLKWRFP